MPGPRPDAAARGSDGRGSPDVIRLSQLKGQRVMTRSGAQQLGSISRLLLDATDGRVVAAELDGVVGEETILDWDSVAAIGPDAVMVEAAGVARGPRSEIEQRFAAGELDLAGKQVIDEAGTALGTLEDIEFEQQTGRLTRVHVPGHALPIDRLVALGPDAIIVPLPVGVNR